MATPFKNSINMVLKLVFLQPITHTDTIVAMARPTGVGAIADIRLSGSNAFIIASSIFSYVSGKELAKQKIHTVHLGNLKFGKKVLDEVLAKWI